MIRGRAPGPPAIRLAVKPAVTTATVLRVPTVTFQAVDVMVGSWSLRPAGRLVQAPRGGRGEEGQPEPADLELTERELTDFGEFGLGAAFFFGVAAFFFTVGADFALFAEADPAALTAAFFLAAGADFADFADFAEALAVGLGLAVAADRAEIAEAALTGVAIGAVAWPIEIGGPTFVGRSLSALALRKPPETSATAVRLPTVTFHPVDCIAGSFLFRHRRWR